MVVKAEICKGLDENELVRKSLEDLEYFGCLYDRYEGRLLRYIRRISCTNEREAEDILQESFIKIWRNLNEFNSNLKLSSWLYRIVHNEAITFCRKKRSFGKDKVIEIDEGIIRDMADEADLDMDPEFLHNKIHEILARLPAKYREALILKFFEKMSYEEISDVLKIPEGTVAIRINRGKKLFREIIDKEHVSFNQQ